jgi:hypothetical protein
MMSAQSTIHVPADQPTIQAAIRAANNGDTVTVAPGTYKENLDFLGKAITVTSDQGAAATIIDGGGAGILAGFSHGETAAAVLSGFTLQNAVSGVSTVNSSPTITNNVIKGHTGCGVVVSAGAPKIQGNTITQNKGSYPACQNGGGISVQGGSAQIVANVISNNTGGGGAGFYTFGAGAVLISGNFFLNNTASGNGGAIEIDNQTPAIVVQNVIAGNKARQGGGVYFLNVPADFTNNTVVDNDAPSGSAVAAYYGGGSRHFANNILMAKGTQTAIFCDVYTPSTIPGFFFNNDVYSDSGAAYDATCGTPASVSGNISVDPAFLSREAQNYRLSPGSPVIGAGQTSLSEVPATDLDGNPRVVGGKIDPGAYEFPGIGSFTLSPASLTFPTTVVGATSSPQTMTLVNSPSVALEISAITLPADFSQTSTCPVGASLAPAASCTIAVSFVPKAHGARSGQLTIAANVANMESFSLSGNATTAVLSLSGPASPFGSQAIGTVSAPQKLTFTNSGDATLMVTSIATSPEFGETGNCATVAPGASCAINVTFQPTGSGLRTGTLTINSNSVDGVFTLALTGTGVAPVPTISAVAPASITAGGPSFNLTVTGTNFVSNSTVQWNGSSRPTAFVSTTAVTATISAADIAAAATASITVFNAAPGGGTSNAVPLVVSGPSPSLSGLIPSAAIAGGPGIQLTVNGSNFVTGSIVQWNGLNRVTTLINSNQLQAAILVSDLVNAGVVLVTVVNPAPGGGTSPPLNFNVQAPNPEPTISAISPASADAGSGAFTLTVTGANFVPSSVVQWNTSARITTFVNGGKLTASILASDVASGGPFNVTVQNPLPGGGTSGPSVFTVGGNPLPAITSLTPSSVVGQEAFTLTVAGTNFIPASIVRWNGADRPTSFVSATQLTASILASDSAITGKASVMVFNPAPGGGASNSMPVSVTANPSPGAISLSPNPSSAVCVARRFF